MGTLTDGTPPPTPKIPTIRLPTIKTMVQVAFKQLESNHRGASVQAIKDHISNTFNFEITSLRSNLIKKHILKFLEEGFLVNVSGSGLRGRLKLNKRNIAASSRRRIRNKIVIKKPKAKSKAETEITTPHRCTPMDTEVPGAPNAQPSSKIANTDTPRSSLPKNSTRKRRKRLVDL